METRGITLDQLYNYLEGKFAAIDRKFEVIDQRLDNIEKRLDLVEYRLDLLERRMDRLEERFDHLEGKVQAIYDTRDKIKLDFNRRILLGNSILAGIVAFIVAMFTGKYEMN